MIKILLVEDDPNLLDLTAYVLRRERYLVVEATDGTQALRRCKTEKPDLVVLDLGLPALDGFEVLRRIRDEEETPVLVVTGRNESQTLLRCFNLGADDFVLKPFEHTEMLARIRAILRRAHASTGQQTEPRVELNGVTIDPEIYEVGWRDQSVRLTPTEFRILYLLATNAGHVVPTSRLYTFVWGSDGGDANALRSHMSHLRRKMELGGAPITLAAVPAIGYILRAEKPRDPAPAPAPQSAAAARLSPMIEAAPA